MKKVTVPDLERRNPMSVVLCCCCKSETLLSPEGAPPTLEFSHPESVFQVWSWLPLGVWWCLRPLQRNLMVTIITTVTRTRAVATPPKMLIMGWKLLDWGLGLGLPWLPWCSGDVDNGFSSPCSLNVLSENRKEKILVKVLNHDKEQWFCALLRGGFNQKVKFPYWPGCPNGQKTEIH